ncbi:hypothetical protein TRFO_26449 [Tritrichomonas foetus]|uniref:Uncharacterized protein n=1 Tax=Tritrichomonas foetus TaxID=1144522 RepID=A0A1J4K302_9EUKA|nr:hypothetical protein TRFO_26449 [Tritrichomonas foetus]|eukprot:OHT05767.1 hypothetical protein TRFO_26449 [Tritrichomonas foetus]
MDSEKIGVHKDAHLLFSSPDGKTFFSFSTDGSVKAWSDKLLASFHDLCEPVKEITYLPEKKWLVVIGELTAFSVISIPQLCSILLCSGHNSPIVEVIYSNGLLHSRCASSSIYTWNIDGQLVSKRKSKKLKRIGQISEISATPMSRSEPALHDKSLHFDSPIFSKIVPLIMPNCQTFAVVLDVFDFLQAFTNYETLQIQSDPSFLPLIMLWRCHVGSRIQLTDKIGLLGSFTYAIAGDNYTVTLPFSIKLQLAEENSKKLQSIPKEKNRSASLLLDVEKMRKGKSRAKITPDKNINLTNSVAFEFSPLLTAIHSVAASATAQCFVGVKNDENLSIISSVSQTTTAMALPTAVCPSALVLANYLMFPSSSLKSVVINVIQELMNNMTEKESNSVIDKVEHNFSKWEVILPFVFIHCLKYKLPSKFGKKCASHVFPVIFESPETLDLFLNCFTSFVDYIDDFQEFYILMLDATISKKIPYNKMAGFGIVKPLEFFDVTVMTPFCPELCEALFERWMNPDREVLLNFISHVLAASRNGISIELDKIFDIIASKISYFASCKSYLVFGSGQGEIIVFSRETTLITWKQQITRFPISCLSISPSGGRFVVIVLEEDNTISWVSPSPVKSKEPFKIDSIEQLPEGIVISDFVWKNDFKVILRNMGKKMIESTAPNATFFQRFKKK